MYNPDTIEVPSQCRKDRFSFIESPILLYPIKLNNPMNWWYIDKSSLIKGVISWKIRLTSNGHT